LLQPLEEFGWCVGDSSELRDQKKVHTAHCTSKADRLNNCNCLARFSGLMLDEREQQDEVVGCGEEHLSNLRRVDRVLPLQVVVRELFELNLPNENQKKAARRNNCKDKVHQFSGEHNLGSHVCFQVELR
jgi:hypothetical protein